MSKLVKFNPFHRSSTGQYSPTTDEAILNIKQAFADVSERLDADYIVQYYEVNKTMLKRSSGIHMAKM